MPFYKLSGIYNLFKGICWPWDNANCCKKSSTLTAVMPFKSGVSGKDVWLSEGVGNFFQLQAIMTHSRSEADGHMGFRTHLQPALVPLVSWIEHLESKPPATKCCQSTTSAGWIQWFCGLYSAHRAIRCQPLAHWIPLFSLVNHKLQQNVR